MRAEAIHPMHRSMLEVRARAMTLPLRPRNMSRVSVTNEQRELIEGIALSIFTDMVNSGATLQETLAAVYLSGCENALEAMRDDS